MPTKREFIEAIASLGDDDEVVIALTYPKPEEGFTLGDESDSPSDSPADSSNDDDDSTIDNEDGTLTEFYNDFGVDVEEVEGENENEKRKVAFLNLELGEEDEEEDDEGENSPSED